MWVSWQFSFLTGLCGSAKTSFIHNSGMWVSWQFSFLTGMCGSAKTSFIHNSSMLVSWQFSFLTGLCGSSKTSFIHHNKKLTLNTVLSPVSFSLTHKVLFVYLIWTHEQIHFLVFVLLLTVLTAKHWLCFLSNFNSRGRNIVFVFSKLLRVNEFNTILMVSYVVLL